MTSLISWVGFDSRGPSSFYLASDSRISWGQNQVWDHGRKVFSACNSPDLFGYCGDVLFPSISLGLIVSKIENGILFSQNEGHREKKDIVFSLIKAMFLKYPEDQVAEKTFKIVYSTRENNLMLSVFHAYTLNWTKNSGFTEDELPIPNSSGLVKAWGSGANSVQKWHDRWQRTSEKGTSRSIFCSFCDSLLGGDDPFSGGPPQLVGIYREGNGRSFGIVFENEKYLFGQRASDFENLDSIEWRNSLFERCDWKTKNLIENGQKHRKPKGLGLSRPKDG